MDQYRLNYSNAQTLARQVLLIKKNQYLEQLPTQAVHLDQDAYVPRIRHWFSLEGFRHKADDDKTAQSLLQAADSWLHSAAASGSSRVYAIRKQNQQPQILYGGSDSDFSAFSDALPECACQEVHPDSGSWEYSGIVLGTIQAAHLSDAIAASPVSECLVSCVALPLPDSATQDKHAANLRLIAQLDRYKSFQRVFGNASRRIQEIPVEPVVQAIAAIKEENDFLERNMGRGFALAAVRICARTAGDYQVLLSRIKGCMEYPGREQTGFEPIRHFPLADRCGSWDACLGIPCVCVPFSCGMERCHLLTFQTLDSVAAFCTPPIRSYPGYLVRNYHIDENTHDVFGPTHSISGRGVELGTIIGAPQPSRIPLSSMRAHTFVTGRTTTGKTTTVKKTLVCLHQMGIPFLVIEAAKKEYAALLPHVPELKVYTAGIDGTPLQINPLQPEDGTLIEEHIQAVVRAITAMDGGEHPIPEAYEGVLQQTYEAFGWPNGTLAYQDAKKPFPTFQDVLENVDTYIRDHACYGPEVRQNLTAALKLRTEHQATGALGKLFSQPQGLTARELLSGPAVIELADFSEQSAAFLMNILLFKIQCYLRRQPESNDLIRVIAVEEAHNVFRKTLCEDSPRALNNHFFEKMLAEVRSSGTGLIISDQRPSIMSSGVLANTAVQVVHGLTEAEDRQSIADAANLSPFQMRKLYEFTPGECIVALGGCYGVQHTRVSPLPAMDSHNPACFTCTGRFRCRKSAVTAMIHEMNDAKLRHHIAKIRANPYNTELLAGNINAMLADLNVTASSATKCCLLGEILANYTQASIQESRIIIHSYSTYLRR